MFIKEVESPQLVSMMEENDDLVIIDVREMHEIARGTIEGAIPMPMATVPLRLNEIPNDKEVVFICRSGARSAQACMFMEQNGFDNVYNLRGGIISWARGNLPIAQPAVA